jgi:hypothetical protein
MPGAAEQQSEPRAARTAIGPATAERIARGQAASVTEIGADQEERLTP